MLGLAEQTRKPQVLITAGAKAAKVQLPQSPNVGTGWMPYTATWWPYDLQAYKGRARLQACNTLQLSRVLARIDFK